MESIFVIFFNFLQVFTSLGDHALDSAQKHQEDGNHKVAEEV